METNRKKGERQGLAWGFQDNAEATAFPMTPELRKQWYSTWQCGAVLNQTDTWLEHWIPQEKNDGEKTDTV